MEAIKKKELYLFKQVIEQIKEKGDNDFTYRLILIEMEIDKHISILDKFKKQEESEKLQKGREQILIKYVEKDEQGYVVLYEKTGGLGQIVTGRGFPRIVGDAKELNEELEKFLEENKMVVAQCETALEKWSEDLDQDAVEFNFKPIPKEILPKLTYDQYKVMFKLIDHGDSGI